MHVAGDPRFKKRVPCRLKVTDSAQSGMVLNVSRGGLFVQSGIGVSPGDAVHLDLKVGALALPVDARVVWRRVVAPHLRSLSAGGIGLHIQYADDAYFGFVAGLAVGTPAEADERAPQGALPSFRVRLRLRGSPRTRVLMVTAADEAEAHQRALDLAGCDWLVLVLAPETQSPQ